MTPRSLSAFGGLGALCASLATVVVCTALLLSPSVSFAEDPAPQPERSFEEVLAEWMERHDPPWWVPPPPPPPPPVDEYEAYIEWWMAAHGYPW